MGCAPIFPYLDPHLVLFILDFWCMFILYLIMPYRYVVVLCYIVLSVSCANTITVLYAPRPPSYLAVAATPVTSFGPVGSVAVGS